MADSAPATPPNAHPRAVGRGCPAALALSWVEMASAGGRIGSEFRVAATVRRGTDARLLERESELSELDSLLSDARAGRGGVAIVEGPAGIGKSLLLDAVREAALVDDMLALRARASELELDYPFGVVRQLFEPALAQLEDPEPVFAGAAGLARHLVDPAAVPAVGTEDRFAVLHGLYWLTANLAERRPLLLAVDDLQWCDAPSLLFLAYLAPRVEDLPVGLLVAVRAGEAVADEMAFEAVASHASARRLRPQPLSEVATHQLLRSTFGQDPDPVFARACHGATAGNPLLLHELVGALRVAGVPPAKASVREIREIGADAVSGFVLRRLERVPDDARRLAVAAAVLGEGAELEEAASLAGVDRSVAADATGALVRANLLRDGGTLGFVHPLVREAVYGTMIASERERAHAKAAVDLEQRHATRKRVALHLLHTPPNTVPGAVETLRAAARRSLAEGAPSGAVAFLKRALSEQLDAPLRVAVLREAGDAALRADPRSAAAYLRDAIVLLDEPGERAAVGLLLGRALYAAGESKAAVEVFERALADAPRSATDLRHHLEYELSNALFGSVRVEEALERGRRLYEQLPSGGGAGSRALLATIAWLAMFLPRQREEAVELASAAVADDLLLKEDTSDAFWSAAWVFLVAEEYELARATVERALARAVPRGSLQWFVWSAYYRSRLAFCLGQLAEAEADTRTALEAAESHGLAIGTPWLAAALGDVLLERGRLDEAAAVVELPDAADRQQALSLLLVTRAEVRLVQGRPAEALADLEEFHRRHEVAGADNRAAPWRPTAARVLPALGRREEGVAMARDEVELARRWGAPRALGGALRVLGELEDGADGLELLREAVAVLEDSPALLERAHALAVLGSALRRAGRRVEARDLLRRALELASLCGADPLANRAHDELVAAGARPRRDPIESRSTLTASELRVARMAAEGMTNREIAQALFLSEKTIENHLSSVYRKLEIGSRSQLARALPERSEPVAH
jgi:DNA-binding NarL/FixJ family response regulator